MDRAPRGKRCCRSLCFSRHQGGDYLPLRGAPPDLTDRVGAALVRQGRRARSEGGGGAPACASEGVEGYARFEAG